MMSLDEAILHAEEVATEQERLMSRYDAASGYARSGNESIRAESAKKCEKCAAEHKQLAAWLRELQESRKERSYWQEKAHSYEQTIFKLTDAISKQSERAEGEWVQIQRCARDAQPDLECPFCKYRIGWWDMGRYCAKCGAKLKGGAE